MKHVKTFVASASIASLLAVPSGTVFAKTTYPMTRKHISLNVVDLSSPMGITATDPSSHHLTTYMPIYYVMKALNSLFIKSRWNGTTWSMTLPQGMSPIGKLAPVKSHPGQKNIVLDGEQIQSVPSIAYPDPASNVMTTYMPVWYIMQILKHLGVESTWDGTDWSMMTSNMLSKSLPPSNTPATIGGPSVVNVTVGDKVDVDFPLLHGTGKESMSCEDGDLPRDLEIASNEYLIGRPQVTGTFHCTFVMDTGQNTLPKSKVVTVHVFFKKDILTLSIPDGYVNRTYPIFQFRANNPVPGIKWWVASGQLPPGLHLSSSGQLSGKPTKAGTYHIRLVATYPDPPYGAANITRNLTITIKN